MPEFTCNRTVTITAKGHCVVIRKGQPSYVPLELAQEAIALGAEPVGVDKEAFLPTDETPEEQLSVEDRNAMIFAAFDQIVASNHSRKNLSPCTSSIAFPRLKTDEQRR